MLSSARIAANGWRHHVVIAISGLALLSCGTTYGNAANGNGGQPEEVEIALSPPPSASSTETAKSPVRRAEGPGMAQESTGIDECDKYIELLTVCSSKMPGLADAANNMREALAQGYDAQATEAVASACKSARGALADVCQQLGAH
jgi:hypothetical protein